MDRFPLVEEYRLIERSESEVNGVWKGAHILLFFLAFVFGSFCTFCFHVLMYLFDEKCVLFPKLLSMSALRHNIIYEFLPTDKDITDNLPVDFLSTQWVDQSACYLPTYVPLVSGIFGLVWTTMFLMCSSGSRTQTGLQRPWRVLPPIFIFSLVMTGICIYASVTTHNGLHELCAKLGELTGSLSCTYTINVATLVYERRIRGVYQATKLTIVSAWLHTLCWLCSALLTLARVLLAVDFQLIRVKVELRCDIDRMLEQHEKHVHTVSPDVWFNNEREQNNMSTNTDLHDSTTMIFKNKVYDATSDADELEEVRQSASDLLYLAELPGGKSELSLVPAESSKLARITAYQAVPKNQKFIVKIIYDLVDTIINLLPKVLHDIPVSQPTTSSSTENVSVKKRESEEAPRELKHETINQQIAESTADKQSPTSKVESPSNITMDLNKHLDTENRSPNKTDDFKSKTEKKSNLKHMAVQTDKTNKKKDGSQKVQISELKDDDGNAVESTHPSQENLQDHETQTSRKEKQD